MNDLAILLRCLQLYAHNAHNLASGVTFFADHEFLGELYPSYEAAYDSIIERMIGLGQKPDLLAIQTAAVALLKTMQPDAFPSLLAGEQKLQSACDGFNARSAYSMGTTNLVAQIADDSEVRTYKLQQRISP